MSESWTDTSVTTAYSPWRDFLRRFAASPSAMVGFVIILFLSLVAIFAPWIATHGFAEQDLMVSLERPLSEGYILGTDTFGRDVFSRLVWGARVSLEVGAIVTCVSLMIGISVGCLAGFHGGRVDLVLANFINLVYGFPLILVALLFVTVWGPSLGGAMVATGLVTWSGFARIVRGEVIALRQREFVIAARALGRSNAWIIVRHILPNIIGPVLIIACMDIPVVITIEAGISFLGLGVPPPAPSWGTILNEGQNYIQDSPWPSIAGGIALILATLGFTFFGETLRDVIDPRLRRDG